MHPALFAIVRVPRLRSSRAGGQAKAKPSTACRICDRRAWAVRRTKTPARLICDRLGWAVMARRSRAPERADSNVHERGARVQRSHGRSGERAERTNAGPRGPAFGLLTTHRVSA